MPAIGGGTSCTKCDTEIAPGNRFCPNCGTRVVVPSFDVQTRVGPRPSGVEPVRSGAVRPPPKSGRSTLFFGGAMQAARAKLTLIRGDGEDGVSFTLAGQEHLAGRGDCPISFPDDPFLSPTHANFIYAHNQLIVRDEGSLNGIYVRISGMSELDPGGTILIGEQVLTVEPAPMPEDVPDQDGTYFSASIARPAVFEIRQHLRGGQIGWVYRPEGEVVSLGREGNDINFPEDPFISGHHAELKLSAGVLSVTDLGSRNGTFIRINGARVLKHGDYVFLGQQLLRVEIV
jgi:pSer/pThr/pTyr-binding forkhead associated (FHA) protein